MFARIFRSQFTYTFPVSIGPKFLRLYFFPANYSDLDIANSFFSVTSSGHTLLSNFSAFLTVSAMKPAVATLRKEFIFNVRDNQRLNITFLPSPNSYAFVNGIEVVSMPKNLYIRGGSDHQIPLTPFLRDSKGCDPQEPKGFYNIHQQSNNIERSRCYPVEWWHWIPVFKDYIIMVTDPDGRRNKQDLRLAMYPDLHFRP
ncbi:unnamed protein product [Ilex paraguariensis]|uniref:Malectin-like domain-containing protein n=1 Tax=Ilex paraguariensis TaxID=185542 RepID=A0ABC8UHT9_9AQUA